LLCSIRSAASCGQPRQLIESDAIVAPRYYR